MWKKFLKILDVGFLFFLGTLFMGSGGAYLLSYIGLIIYNGIKDGWLVMLSDATSNAGGIFVLLGIVASIFVMLGYDLLKEAWTEMKGFGSQLGPDNSNL